MNTWFRWFALSLLALTGHAQDPGWKFPCPANEIARYTAQRVTEDIRIDGELKEQVWQDAATSPRFIDIITGQPTLHQTRAMVVWDERNLYVAYRVTDPNVKAKYAQHNDPIYYDNDVECFIAGPDSYYEFEVNALNTCYEVFFIWEDAYESRGFAAAPEFARANLKPFNGVGFTTHPRGPRLGHFEWTFPGKQTAVHVDGTLNDDRDTDRGWTVELAFPWKGFRWLATDGRAYPPRDGDVWRMDFSRFNTYKAPPPAQDYGGWVWTRHGVWDSHIPECFVFVQFTTNVVGPRRTATAPAAPAARWWSDAAEAALAQAGTNRHEIQRWLGQTPEAQRAGAEFLVMNMPACDVQSLSAAFLAENLALAYEAMRDAPWAASIREELFLNDVLPYASVNEPRDNWRKRLRDVCLPLVKECKTPAEAAQALNRRLFPLLNVRYSTKRRAPDQGPLETMETGLATCTGLSILLVDACRAVGVPARIAGTPLWTDRSGNHTWVEIWDGDWHFMGAAEPSPDGLDRGWFVGKASQAVKDDRRHAIYATSFRKAGLTFPLPWARRVDYVSAVNVTDRYAAKTKKPEPSGTLLAVDVLDRPAGERVAAKVTVTDASDPTIRFENTSKGPTADENDHLYFDLPKQRTYGIEAESNPGKVSQFFTTGTNTEDRLVLFLGGIPPVPAPPRIQYVPPPITKPLSSRQEASLRESFTAFFTAPINLQATWEFPRSLERLLRVNEPAVRRAAWEAFRAAPIHDALRQDFEAQQVRFEKHLSPYTVKTVGTRPPGGWALFIAMHGGGGAPQEVNDSQWKVMQRYYRDHPEAGGYVYVALRAPNNEWNGFYTGYVYPLIETLLRQFLLLGDVDPNKQFIMGYSHGGYGAFAIGPKMPDRFAAVHASAAAPADGASPVTLRNTIFTCMLGAKDTMYSRYELIQSFQQEVEQLRVDQTDIYPVTVSIIADHGHPGLPDRDKIAEMYPAVRNPVPRELTWRLTDSVIRDFFWLRVPKPSPGMELRVACRDNRLSATATRNLTAASMFLDARLVDFAKPVVLELNGLTSKHRLRPSLRTLCDTLQRRGDPELAFTAELPLPSPGPTPQGH